MSVDILGTSWDQCRSMVQYSFTSTETRSLVRTDSPGRPPRLSHSSWTMAPCRGPGSSFKRSCVWGMTRRAYCVLHKQTVLPWCLYILTPKRLAPNSRGRLLAGQSLWKPRVCKRPVSLYQSLVGLGPDLSLICHPTSEDIKNQRTVGPEGAHIPAAWAAWLRGLFEPHAVSKHGAY